MEQCHHGLSKPYCNLCTPAPSSKPPRTPQRSQAITDFGLNAIKPDALADAGIYVVRTFKGRNHGSFDALGEKTTFVHFDGHPFLWAVEKVLERAPHLKTLQVIPPYRRFVDPPIKAHQLLTKRGVVVTTGHVRPELAWEPDRIVSKSYEPQRQFLLRLEGDQRQLFDELLAMRFEGALIVARYYCLNGEDYLPQRALMERFGFTPRVDAEVSARINSVLHYLDPGFPACVRSKQMTATMTHRVEKLRPLLRDSEKRQQLATDLGLAALPADFPLARIDVLRSLIAAIRDGRFDQLLPKHSNVREAIVLRFGLEDDRPIYRTLQQVGEEMGDITRERVRQLEERALEVLGIAEE